jgi:hypothetical protein
MKMLVAGALMGALTLLGSGARPEEGEAGKPPSREFVVWKLQHVVYAQPRSSSRILAMVPQGGRLEVLEERASWSRVRFEGEGGSGWAVLDAPPAGAGERLRQLEGKAAPSSIALAVKGLKELGEEVARKMPDAEKGFQALLGSFIASEELEDFAAAGGLRLPETGGRS